MVTYVGLDWSGDPGDPGKAGSQRLLVYASIEVEQATLPDLSAALGKVRQSLSLPATYCFRYATSRQRIREAFLDEIMTIDWAGAVSIIDKSEWSERYLRSTTGPDRLIDGCAAHFVTPAVRISNDRFLVVDASRSEGVFVRQIRSRLSSVARTNNTDPFGKVKPIPDHRPDGEIVQLADMVAGIFADEAATAMRQRVRGRIVGVVGQQKPRR